MSAKSATLAHAERNLEQARQMLLHPNNYQPEEWMLLATLVGEADLAIREEQKADPNLQLPILQQVITEFREATANFTDAGFVRASRAARRRNPRLFSAV